MAGEAVGIKQEHGGIQYSEMARKNAIKCDFIRERLSEPDSLHIWTL